MKRKSLKLILAAVIVFLMVVETAPMGFAATDDGTAAGGNEPAEWAKAEISAAAEIGIDTGELEYTSNITRQEFAGLIYRMICIREEASEMDSDQTEGKDAAEDGGAASDPSGGDEVDADQDAGTSTEKPVSAGELQASGQFKASGKTEAVIENEDDAVNDGALNDDSQGVNSDLADGEPADEPQDQVGDETETDSPFTDTDDEAVLALYDMGIVKGMTDTTFAPDANLTREQGAALLVRAAKYLGYENPNGEPLTFYDGGKIGAWAREDIKFISGHKTPDGTGVMRGAYSKFNPKGTYTVQEALLSVYRLYLTLFEKPSTDTSWKTKTGCLLTEVVLSAAGDCTLGRDLNAAYATSLDAEYDKSGGDPTIFFKNVTPFFNDDITIVNFEGTLTDSTNAAVKTFRFKGRKEYTNIIKSGSIDVVNIANNHSHDYLEKGFSDTVNNLSAAGIGFCGYNYTCIKEVNGIKYGFYGLAPMGSGLTDAMKTTINARVSELRSKGAQYIVGSFHWGIERQYYPTDAQKAIAHYAASNGTDLILGHHPHVLQTAEKYNGVQIIYSLGNFCFGGNKNPADKDTAVFQEKVVFDVETGKKVSQSRYLYPCRLSSVTNRNDYRPTLVSGKDADRVYSKIWV